MQFVHSTLRNKHSVPLNSDYRADLAKPAGTQQVPGVWELHFDENCSRSHVHLAIKGIKAAFVRIDGSVREAQLPFELVQYCVLVSAQSSGLLHCIQVFLFAGCEIHQNRIDR